MLKNSINGTYTDEKGFFKLSLSQSLPSYARCFFGGVCRSGSNCKQCRPVNHFYYAYTGIRVGTGNCGSCQPVAGAYFGIAGIYRKGKYGSYPQYTGYFLLRYVANLKGVDITTSSFTFKTPSTRGFNGSGNLRFNQFVDGMDNTAPALNFSVGSIIGLTELDVDNMELLPGSSSALYGSGGMNGTLLITSKNPFKYQGFSAQVKEGVMHVDDPRHKASPYHDISFQLGQKISDKFAFKIGSQFIKANDWVAE